MATPSCDQAIDERLVARLWDAQHPFLLPLRTVAGEGLRVVYRGRRRFDRGPDFPGAIISFPGEVLVSGDIEIHVNSSDWRRHGHHLDPFYNSVVLHVVLHHDAQGPCLRQDGAAVPTVELAGQFSRPLEDLLSPEAEIPRVSPCLPGSAESPELAVLLGACGMERFEARVRRFEADLTCLPPDEVLFRGIADVLGYSQNREPFRSLVELVPLGRLLEYRRAGRRECGSEGVREGEREGVRDSQNPEPRTQNPTHHSSPITHHSPQSSVLSTQHSGPAPEALLLGAAGLLPSQRGMAADGNDPYVEALERVWAAEGPRWIGDSMDAGEWVFFRVRPANFPPRRVAALAFVAGRWPEEGLASYLAALALSLEPRRLARALEAVLIGSPREGYWATRCDFGQALRRPADLVGRGRAAEVAVNLFLPFLAAVASSRGDEDLAVRSREAYRLYPKRGDNELGRYTAAQITGVPRPAVARSACRQQGLFHIFRTWCEVKNCGECPVTG